MQEQGTVCFGGVPTEPQVKQLMDAFGTPQPGVIDHSAIETAIGEKRTSSRYRTVVGAWRRRLFREANIVTTGEPGVGVRVLTEPERVDHACGRLRRGTREIGRGGTEATLVRTSELGEVDRRKCDHLRVVASRMVGEVVGNMKSLNAEFKAAAQLPRPKM